MLADFEVVMNFHCIEINVLGPDVRTADAKVHLLEKTKQYKEQHNTIQQSIKINLKQTYKKKTQSAGVDIQCEYQATIYSSPVVLLR